MGWRVELRTMETQFTDFENAAFTVFIVLASRVILAFELNLYIPLSQVRGVVQPMNRPLNHGNRTVLYCCCCCIHFDDDADDDEYRY